MGVWNFPNAAWHCSGRSTGRKWFFRLPEHSSNFDTTQTKYIYSTADRFTDRRLYCNRVSWQGNHFNPIPVPTCSRKQSCSNKYFPKFKENVQEWRRKRKVNAESFISSINVAFVQNRCRTVSSQCMRCHGRFSVAVRVLSSPLLHWQ